MLWLEVPSNPLLKYLDIEAASKIAHEYKLLVVIDATFISPYFMVSKFSKRFLDTFPKPLNRFP